MTEQILSKSMKGLQFQREEYSHHLVAEFLPIWKEHWREIAHYRDIPLEPDLELYEQIANSGALRIFTMRESGNLHGYEVFFVKPNLHYKSSLQAVQDILFLREEYRRGLTAYRFIKWADEQLKSDGVEVVFQHLKVYADFGIILHRLGYENQDIIMSRRLT